MSFNDMTKQIYNLSIGGYINGETKSLAQFRREIKPFLDTERIPTQVAFIMCLSTGYWYCVATRTAWGYDYYIPTDRQDEERLKRETGYYD